MKKNKKLKFFEVSFDATFITLFAEDKKDVLKLLKQYDEGFKCKKGEYYYECPDLSIDQVSIKEVKIKRGIIQSESH